jgi:hypothetical protein
VSPRKFSEKVLIIIKSIVLCKMQAKKRYILVFICAFLLFCYFGGFHLKILQKFLNYTARTKNLHSLPNFLQDVSVGAGADTNSAAHDPVNSKRNSLNFHLSSNSNRNSKYSDDLLSLPDDSSAAASAVGASVTADLLQLLPESGATNNKLKPCRMETCFDFTKCYTDFLGEFCFGKNRFYFLAFVVVDIRSRSFLHSILFTVCVSDYKANPLENPLN